MAWEAAIPSVIPPDFIGSALKQQELASYSMENKQKRQQMEQQKALKDIFATADTSTPEGQQDLIRQVGRVDPNAALSLQAQFGKQSETNALIQEHKSKTALNQADLEEQRRKTGMEVGGEFARVGDLAFNSYQSQVKQGILPKEAWDKASGQIKSELDSLKQRYGNDPHAMDLISKIDPSQLTPETLQQGVQQLKTQLAGAQQNKVPVGYQQDPNKPGELIPVKGGPADPEAAAKLSAAKRETLSEVEAKAKARELAKSAGEVALSEDDAKFLGKQLASGDTSVLTNMGRGAQGAKNVVRIRHAAIEHLMDQGASPEEAAARVAEFQGLKAGERALGTRTANVEMAVAEAQNSANIALKASEAFPRTQWMPVNKALNALESGSGSVEARRFGAAVNTFINTYARAISPTGTPTVSDKDHAREVLSTADSPEQFKGVMDVLQQEMAAARKAPGQVRKEFREGATGKTAAPKQGDVMDGYRFKGGDPSKKESWEKV